MAKILGIVFSKDRPCQLDLFLRSMKKFCPDTFKTVVIQKSTNYNYEQGYKIVHKRNKNGVYTDDVVFIGENNLRDDLFKLVEHHSSQPSWEDDINKEKSKCVGLFTDDSVFHKQFHLDDEVLSTFLTEYNVFSFSTRLGQNLLYQKHWEPKLPIRHPKKYPVTLSDGQTVYSWKVNDVGEHDDFGRAISPDGNIHLVDELFELLCDHEWNTIRDLDIIQPRDFNVQSSSFEHSVLVNIPSNIVHDGGAENWGKYHPKSQEDLNRDFLQGRYVDLENLFTEPIVSAHQEFQLEQTLEGGELVEYDNEEDV